MARPSDYMNFLHRSFRKPAWFALLFLCAGLGFGSRGKAASLPDISRLSAPAAFPFAIADFDGDNRPDLATVEIGQVGFSRAHYWIGFQMSAGARQRIGVTAPVGGLEIASRDVNGDTFLDLIVTTAWFKDPVAVLVNDGHGKFTLTDPTAFSTIIWYPQQIWAQPHLDVKDPAIAVLARSSGDCVPRNCVDQGAAQPEVPPVATSRRRASVVAISVLGRAPPPFVYSRLSAPFMFV
jgi:hypothetical protein